MSTLDASTPAFASPRGGEIARPVLDDRIELGQLSVYDLARTAEKYDLVLFLGVLYHLRHPLLALDVLQRVKGRWAPDHACAEAMRAAELRAVFAIPGEPP